MTNCNDWDDYRGKIKTKKGGWKIGQKVESHGYDLINDLIGNYSYMQIIVLNATGRMPSKALAYWLEAIYISMSWPDPRIWCNRISTLGASSGADIVTSVSAGIMAADSRHYGVLPLIEGVELIQRAKKIIKAGVSVEDFVAREVKQKGGKPFLMGYARPLAKGDERILSLENVAKELGFKRLEHLNIAYGIENVLSDKFDESINLNGYISAFMSDQGFSPIEVYHIFSVLPFSGMVACYVDAFERPKGSFAPLHTKDIEYVGVPDRRIN